MSDVLFFRDLRGNFTDKNKGKHVAVKRVSGPAGFLALIFQTPLNEDMDGAPNTYAPPRDADHLHQPLNPAKKGLDDIRNATDQAPPPPVVFSADGNTWHWAGLQSKLPAEAGGLTLDDRPFLADADGKLPVLAASGFYISHSSKGANPLTVPYAALSGSMKNNGVGLGDFGLAIRASTGASTGFVYADAGGEKSTSVGECSTKMIENLFGASTHSEAVCYVVFPGTAVFSSGTIKDPTPKSTASLANIRPRTKFEIAKLSYASNVDELVKAFSYPENWAWLGPQDKSRLRKEEDSTYVPRWQNVMQALREWGYHR